MHFYCIVFVKSQVIHVNFTDPLSLQELTSELAHTLIFQHFLKSLYVSVL